jgi:SAM-dependent MidA family methyltransferase
MRALHFCHWTLEVGRAVAVAKEGWTLDVFCLNTELVEFIRDTIHARGPQPFAWFMEQALYHPEHGYYSTGRAAIGRHGDYFTNVSVGPIFGRLLAAQFAEIWEQLDKSASRTDSSRGEIDNFVIVEEGAHHGDFARDVLEFARERFPEFYSALRYRIVEPFAALQDRQTQTLGSFGNKVQWLKTLTPFVGVHFSNELLDAMPVNLRGKLVGLDGDEFVFVEQSISPELQRNAAALNWIDNVAANLQRGFVITIDYGFPRSAFHESLQVRAQHRHLDSPFEQIGQADITMHINWSEIAERAEANGLRIAGFTDQHHFLTGILSHWPELLETRSLDSTALSGRVHTAGFDERITRGLQTLLHPEMLGRAFQVLALSKDVDPPPATAVGVARPLAGFKFARDSRAALGV